MRLLIDEYRNILAIIAIELVLILPCMEKRNHYWLRLVSGIVFSLLFVSLYGVLHKTILTTNSVSLISVISVIWYILVVIWTGGLMAFCHKMNMTELVWILITSYAAQHFIYVAVIELIFFGLLGSSGYVWQQLLAYIAFTIAICTLMYFLFTPNLRARKHLYVQNSLRNCIVLSVFLFIFLASTFINQANARQDYVGINYLSVCSDFVNCVLVVAVQYVSLRGARLRNEKEMAFTLLRSEKKQYETFKNAVDYINIKCHDLKHEIAAIHREGVFNKKRLDEITDKISVYESFANTGNETLDFLITEKNLECSKLGISLSCMADASGFRIMEAEDIFVLFGNMLDNAVEYLKNVEDGDKRFIRLYINRHGNLNIIHQENYFEGDLTFANGLPQTIKPDRINHGYGVKSMRRIAEKYGGEMSVSVNSNIFKIDIVIVC